MNEPVLEILAAAANLTMLVAFVLGLIDRWKEYKHQRMTKGNERRDQRN